MELMKPDKKNVHTEWFYLHKIPESANESVVIEADLSIWQKSGRGWEWEIATLYQNTLGGD